MRALIIVEIVLSILNTAAALGYATRKHWWQFAMGRHLMVYSGAWACELTALLCLGLRVPLPLWVYAVVFGLVFVATGQRLWLILRGNGHPSPQLADETSS
jgi:hypothetical protein